MATVVLNVSVELSSQYELSKLETSLTSNIKTKWSLSIKYANSLNSNGSGFVDNISCPQGITMSGTTLRTTNINTNIRFLSWSIVCLAENAHNWEDLQIFFNNNYNDVHFLDFWGYQRFVNSWSLTVSIPDSDATQVDLVSSAYISPDGYDDNFNSDNYLWNSTWSIDYPDGYSDQDDWAGKMQYWYVLEDSGLYNIFWSNSAISSFIDNAVDDTAYFAKVWDVSSGHLHLDIDSDFRIVLYEIDKSRYNETKELYVTNSHFWTGQIANIWYLQNDMTLSTSIDTNTFDFNFQTTDYALFLENTSSGALLYRLTWEQAGTGTWIYLNPLDMWDTSVYSYLWSHVLVDDEQRLIADQFEVFWLK